MSDEKQTEVVAKIDMATYSTAEDLRFIIDQLHNHAPYEIQYVNDPDESEPDFYLLAEVED